MAARQTSSRLEDSAPSKLGGFFFGVRSNPFPPASQTSQVPQTLILAYPARAFNREADEQRLPPG